MLISDRDSALAFLRSRIDHERKTDAPYRESVFKLDRMGDLLARLDDPHLRLPIVHVAGTKGKGSTAAMIASILTASGYRVGLYTSPHLLDLEERLAIDGQPCSSDELVALVAQVADAAGELDRQAEAAGEIPDQSVRRPTYFEITTAMAWMHFISHKVNLAVLEVGLGGRLDSTNLCRPLVTAITSISLDHVRQLGGTLASIAGEKAGIIKAGIPVVSGVTAPEPAEVIERRADELGSPLWRLGREYDYEYRPSVQSGHCARFDFTGEIDGQTRTLRNLEIGLLGRHQAQNAAVALATIARLERPRWRIDEPALRIGLASARCPARIESVSQSPAVVLDVAHNVASVEALCATLVEQFGQRPKRLVFASSSDKDARGMLAALWPHFERIVLTRFHNSPRGIAVEELLAIARDVGRSIGAASDAPRVESAPDARTAWERVLEGVGPEHVVCVAGSFFIAAEMRSLWASQNG